MRYVQGVARWAEPQGVAHQFLLENRRSTERGLVGARLLLSFRVNRNATPIEEDFSRFLRCAFVAVFFMATDMWNKAIRDSWPSPKPFDAFQEPASQRRGLRIGAALEVSRVRLKSP